MMCGIIYCENIKGKPVNRLVMDQFLAQRNRGIDGFGLYDLDYKNMVRTPKERKIMSWLKRHKSTALLFHHRFPTSTINVKNACHPFSTRDFFKTNYILVHNGCISNADTLKEAHEKLGIKYSSEQKDGSFNDSEALLWDFALYMERKQKKLKASGSIAFVCIALGKKSKKLHFGRNFGSPLNLHQSNRYFMLSSEGQGQSIETTKLYSYDYSTRKLTDKYCEVPSGWGSWNNSYSDTVSYYNNYYDGWYKAKPVYKDDKSILSLDDLGSTITEDGDLLDLDDLKKEIETLYAKYMLWSYGYFGEAVNSAEADLTVLQGQLAITDDKKKRKIYTRQIELIKQVIQLIDENVNYVGEDAFDVGYFNRAVEKGQRGALSHAS